MARLKTSFWGEGLGILTAAGTRSLRAFKGVILTAPNACLTSRKKKPGADGSSSTRLSDQRYSIKVHALAGTGNKTARHPAPASVPIGSITPGHGIHPMLSLRGSPEEGGRAGHRARSPRAGRNPGVHGCGIEAVPAAAVPPRIREPTYTYPGPSPGNTARPAHITANSTRVRGRRRAIKYLRNRTGARWRTRVVAPRPSRPRAAVRRLTVRMPADLQFTQYLARVRFERTQ
ncbi:hypothetical protein CPLU01_04780 [Colletotrichum plurivorum]|uniref:Uncharacterized protein n=1 Tax=Colletotrichum plurivorum TaxID=2175906 RepID=A0A8H6KPS3_9PEZI|nr:hypothetical protein CPLU01_04780 [Colletotrichum plurivorum]